MLFKLSSQKKSIALGVFFAFSPMAFGKTSVESRLEALEVKVAQKPRYGVWDMKRVVSSVKDGLAAQKKITEAGTKAQKEILAEKGKLEALQKTLAQGANFLKPEALAKKQKEWEQKMQAFQRMVGEKQSSVQMLEQELLKPVMEKVMNLVKVVSDAEGLTLSFERSVSGAIYMGSLPEDLTDKIISMYDKMTEKKASKPSVVKG